MHQRGARLWLPLWIAGGVLSGVGSQVHAQPNEGRGVGKREPVQRKAPDQKERVPQAEAPLMPLTGVVREPTTGVAVMPVLGVGEEYVRDVKTSAARSARLLPYVETIASGDRTAAQVWESGKFTVEDVLFALEHLITSNGVIVGRKGSPLVKQQGETARAGLAGLLAQHGGERLREWEEKSESLALRVRLWLGEHYGKKGDERAVPLLESVLEQGQKQAQAMPQKKLKNAPATYFLAAEKLAWFYRDKGKPEEAAKAWLHVPQLLDESDWRGADAAIEAARFYIQTGSEAKEKESYQKAIISGDEWMANAALREYVSLLEQRHKTQEMQQLLEGELESPKAAQDSRKTIVTALLSLLYYSQGEMDKAQRYSRMALVHYKLVRDERQRQGVKNAVDKAEEVERFIEQWKRQPLVCDPAIIALSTGQEVSDVPIVRRFLASSFRSVDLRVSSDSPLVTARIEESPWAQEAQPMEFQKMVVVEIAVAALRDDFKANLTLSSPQLPKAQIQVPISVGLR